MVRGRREILAGLLASIENTLDWEFDRENFEDRLRIQKYVYFADSYGAEVPYSYGIHLYGPYSPDLAEDYYSDEFDEMREEADPQEFNTEGYRELLKDRSTDWLEVAATIRRLHSRHSDGRSGQFDTVIAKVCELKETDIETVSMIYDELLEADAL